MKLSVKTANLSEAEKQAPKLTEDASNGDSFVISKAAKPLVKVIALTAPMSGEVRRLGFIQSRYLLILIEWVKRKLSQPLAVADENSCGTHTQRFSKRLAS